MLSLPPAGAIQGMATFRESIRFMHLLSLDESGWAEASWSLGAVTHADGVEFAVHAPVATRVQLELFGEATGQQAFATFLPAKGPDGVWRAKLQGLQLGTLYGYRVWGPNWEFDEEWEPGSEAGFVSDFDEDGNRFNPNKLLLDPYAKAIDGTFDWNQALFGYDFDDPDRPTRELWERIAAHRRAARR